MTFPRRHLRLTLFVSAAIAGAAPALAQGAASSHLPQPAPPVPPIEAPRDIAYAPGALKLDVDVTDLDHRIFQVHETIPVAGPGPMTLLFPQWLPGNHSPSGPLPQLAGLVITADGRRVEWTRDPVEVFAFHVNVPAGATALELRFQHLSPTTPAQGRVVVSPEMVNLEWNAVVLYPAGHFARDIPVDVRLTSPADWGYATGLETQGRAGAAITFKRTDLDTLVDSPLYTGKYFKTIDMEAPGSAPVRLNIMADKPDELIFKPEEMQDHKNLVRQAYKLYGSHHYDHYDFLLLLSDKVSGVGLEHHQSSEDGVGPDYFKRWSDEAGSRDLLPHEYTHSWNGKFRRPFDLWTPNFNVPMRDSLLWVYEGQTQYWGYVLAARSGLWSSQTFLDALAAVAATYDNLPGRSWRALQDTTNDPIINQRRPLGWRSWQRAEDYYSEGQLMWLDADTLIRERSGGKRSLDDFAKRFFGRDDGSHVPLTYTFDDVVADLNAVEPYDWAAFLRTRLDGHGPGAPLDGLKRGGYRLTYTETPSDFVKHNEAERKITDLSFSLGLVIGREGVVSTVMWDGPAFKAGMISGQTVAAVNGSAYSPDILKDAVKAGRGKGGGVELLLKAGDQYKTVRIAYDGGLRYPHLEKTGAGSASLDLIAAPKT